ncbi:unnamed protein product, partial [marine sediment metagenome]
SKYSEPFVLSSSRISFPGFGAYSKPMANPISKPKDNPNPTANPEL